MFSAVDLLPTFCELAGVKLPESYSPDGISQVGTLLGNGYKTRSTPLFWKMQSAWPIQQARPFHWVSFVVVYENWKLVANRDSSYVELFDIVADPDEKADLKEQYPGVVQHLTRRIDEWKVTLPDRPTGSVFSTERDQAEGMK